MEQISRIAIAIRRKDRHLVEPLALKANSSRAHLPLPSAFVARLKRNLEWQSPSVSLLLPIEDDWHVQNRQELFVTERFSLLARLDAC